MYSRVDQDSTGDGGSAQDQPDSSQRPGDLKPKNMPPCIRLVDKLGKGVAHARPQNSLTRIIISLRIKALCLSAACASARQETTNRGHHWMPFTRSHNQTQASPATCAARYWS